jgi:hypothetical protein
MRSARLTGSAAAMRSMISWSRSLVFGVSMEGFCNGVAADSDRCADEMVANRTNTPAMSADPRGFRMSSLPKWGRDAEKRRMAAPASGVWLGIDQLMPTIPW